MKIVNLINAILNILLRIIKEIFIALGKIFKYLFERYHDKIHDFWNK